MLFNSFGYLIFLPIVTLLFWLSPQRFRTSLLLVASYVFYMSWKPVYGLLIFGLTALNYLFGLIVHRAGEHRKLALTLAIAANLLMLGVFKYAYFARDTVAGVLEIMHRSLPSIPFQIILPLGISFFVFEFIHYVSDVYKGGEPVRSFPAFALFASFFPTQIAGPIKRYQDFVPQLSVDRKFNIAYLDEGVGLILFGLFKKVLFADNLAVVVQSTFARPELLTGVDMWMAVYAFAFQIYFDFSGYTDIARGSAMLFGYKVPLNFNLPYLASSMTDFWRRWHISLSTWLRDYLFIPLGGSRCSQIFCYRNLLITMILGGLWHGASMHFVAWGAYQGFFLVLHKEWRRLAEKATWLRGVMETGWYRIFSIFLTFQVVCIGWVFFRAETMNAALSIIGKLLFLDRVSTLPFWTLTLPATVDPVIFSLLPCILVLLFIGQVVASRVAEGKVSLRIPLGVKAVYLATIVCLLLVFSPDTSPRFIYFQF